MKIGINDYFLQRIGKIGKPLTSANLGKEFGLFFSGALFHWIIQNWPAMRYMKSPFAIYNLFYICSYKIGTRDFIIFYTLQFMYPWVTKHGGKIKCFGLICWKYKNDLLWSKVCEMKSRKHTQTFAFFTDICIFILWRFLWIHRRNNISNNTIKS